MKRCSFLGRAGAPLLVGLLVGGCLDGTKPNLEGASVAIYLGSERFDEQTIAVGSSLALGANILDAANRKVPDESVAWSSENPGVATVDANGLVLGLAVGTTEIVARHAVGEARALVNVAEPLSGTPSCDATDELELAVSETVMLSGPQAARICLPGDADYSLVVFNQASTAGATLQAEVRATGVRSSGGGPAPQLMSLGAATEVRTNPHFHQLMRETITARLEPRLRMGVDPASFDFRPQANVGEVLTFNVESFSSDGCSADAIDRRGTRVRLITDRSIIVEDTLNPAGGFTAADYQEFGDFFDDEVWPLVTGTFGEPSDIDRNGKVYIIFTRGVNERRENSTLPDAQGTYVGGFFFNRDLFSTTGGGGRKACPGSNEGEMFYLLVPDPQGVVKGRDDKGSYSARSFQRDFVRRSTFNVLVHEFQHLVNDSRRLHVNSAPVWEESWLNEGLSHIAEELMFYRGAGLSPGQNLAQEEFESSSQARTAYRLFQLANLERIAALLRDPDGTSLMGSDGLGTRGATWLFLRYVADRVPNEAALWRNLVTDARTAGMTNLQEALGFDPREWMADWAAAVYLDDVEQLDANPRFQIPSWNHRSLFPASRLLWATGYTTFPLQLHSIPAQPASRTFSLDGGAAVYLRTAVDGEERAAIRIALPGNLPAPSRLKVAVTRTE